MSDASNFWAIQGTFRKGLPLDYSLKLSTLSRCLHRLDEAPLSCKHLCLTLQTLLSASRSLKSVLWKKFLSNAADCADVTFCLAFQQNPSEMCHSSFARDSFGQDRPAQLCYDRLARWILRKLWKIWGRPVSSYQALLNACITWESIDRICAHQTPLNNKIKVNVMLRT